MPALQVVKQSSPLTVDDNLHDQLQNNTMAHEKDRRKPSFANIRALAKALHVSSDFLLGRVASLEGATTAFRNEDKLTGADRETIQAMIDTLSERRRRTE